MRVLLVGLNYAPELVGIGPYTSELAEHFVKEGHQVTVLTGFPYYPQWQIDPRYRSRRPFMVEELNGVKVIRSPVLLPSTHGAFHRILFDSSIAATALLGSIVLGRLDVVICISPPLQLSVTAWLIAKSRGAQLVLHLQDLVPDAAVSVGMMTTGIAFDLARRLEVLAYSTADRITVISEGFAANLVGKGIPIWKLELLPNWVESSRFNVRRDRAVRSALGAVDGETLVIHTGNMGAKQGLETIVDSAESLAHDGVVLTLVGDGNCRSALEARAAKLAAGNIRFLPIQADFPATLAAADISLLTQRGQVVDSVAPSKLLSYMASGKPVIASVNERSEAARIVRLAQCGLVIEPDNPSALISAIRLLQSRPDDCRRFGEKGRAFAVQHYERSVLLQSWGTFLKSAI